MRHINGLDTLRAFAVFFVIIQHFGVWFDYTSPSGRFITQVLIPDGGFGVDLFFVLSGFLITSLLLNAAASNAGGHKGVVIRNFYIRRALRIFPVYYFLLLVLVCIPYPDVKQYFWYFATYTSNILCYTTNKWNAFSHSWTLAVEEQFYLLWPWLIVFIRRRYLVWVIVAAIIAGIVSSYVVMDVQGKMAPFLVFNCFDAFGLGALFAIAYNDGEVKSWFRKVVWVLLVPALVFYGYHKLSDFYNRPAQWFFLLKTANSIIALWLIMLVVTNKNRLVEKYFLSNRFLNYIGRISYGLYLYHYVYINYFFSYVNKWLYDITLPLPAVNKVVHDSHADYWIEVAVMVAIASLSYYFLEMPILRLKNKFRYSGA